jgi:hypothetical protein
VKNAGFIAQLLVMLKKLTPGQVCLSCFLYFIAYYVFIYLFIYLLLFANFFFCFLCFFL